VLLGSTSSTGSAVSAGSAASASSASSASRLSALSGLCALHQIGQSTAIGLGFGDDIGFGFSTECFVGGESCRALCSWVDGHDHPNLAMLCLRAVDSHGLRVLDCNSEARKGSGARKEDVVLAAYHLCAGRLLCSLCRGGCRGGTRRWDKARVELSTWGASGIRVASGDSVVLSSKHVGDSITNSSVQSVGGKGKSIVLSNNDLVVSRKDSGRLDESKDDGLGEMHLEELIDYVEIV